VPQPEYLVATSKKFGCHNQNSWVPQPEYLVATSNKFGCHNLKKKGKMVATTKTFG